MRTALIDTLIELSRADERIFLVTADLGWSVVERFRDAFPDRFLNVGVAEANMAGVATGLALAGFTPFVYSIATFSSMRCYEQVRNGPVLHRLPVRVVGIGGGFAYGHAGPTHHALEDLAIARTQPGMTVLAPCDPAQTRAALLATAACVGPVYLRIGKGGNAPVPGLDGRFALDAPEVVREGSDVLLLACGSIALEATRAAQALGDAGVSASVAVLAHLGYRGSDALAALLARHRAVVTVEEGYTAGGLGSLAAETIAERGIGARLSIVGVRGPCEGESGSEAYMRRRSGIDADSIAGAARRLLGFGGSSAPRASPGTER